MPQTRDSLHTCTDCTQALWYQEMMGWASVCAVLWFLLSSVFSWLYCHPEPCFGGQKNA